MGSITYNFLANSILFDEKEIDNQYSSLSDNQLEYLLNDYREHCLTNIAELTKEVTENESSLKVLSSIESVPYETLKQSALYFDQFVIYDPLFPLTHQKNEAANVMAEYLGYEKDGLDRLKISKTAKLLKSITPMIAANFVKILPLSKAFEPPKEIPIFLPKNYYADDLPKEIMTYCRENAIVNSMGKATKGWQILDKQDYTPAIYINFKDCKINNGQIYNYFYQEYEKTEDPNIFNVKMKLADYPMDKNTWDMWVYQSINKSAKTVVDKIFYENTIARNLKTTYLTDNKFTANILTKNIAINETIETSSASQFMNLRLPFLERVNINKLMSIREYEAETFTNFRIELERQFRELRSVSDKDEIKMRQENIIHELGDVQVKKINQKFDSLKRKGITDSLLLIGGLAGTVQTGGWSLIAAALATVSGFKSYQEYKEKLTENPSYLLWKVLDK